VFAFTPFIVDGYAVKVLMRKKICFFLFLFFMLPSALFAEENTRVSTLWSEENHIPVKFFSAAAGGGYNSITPGGYKDLYRRTVELPVWYFEVFSPDLLNSERRTVFSSLKISSSLYMSLPDEYIAHGKKDDIYSAFALELKTPSTFSFLGHETPLYFGAELDLFRFSSRADAKIGGEGRFVLEKGEYISLTSRSDRYYIGVNTPAARGDAPISSSRFGVFYSQSVRPRYATFPDDTDHHWIFKESDRYAGIFYRIVKPLAFKGFALGTKLHVGFGFRELIAGSSGRSNKDFENSRLYLYTDLGLLASYQYGFTDNFYMNLYFDYTFLNSTLLQSKSEGAAAYKNDGENRFSVRAAFIFYY
jgi:hypothetical protein